MAHLQNQNIAFSELDRLADYLSAASNNPPNLGADLPTGTVDPKKYPIVLGSFPHILEYPELTIGCSTGIHGMVLPSIWIQLFWRTG